MFFAAPSVSWYSLAIFCLGRRNYHYLMAGLVMDEIWDGGVQVEIIDSFKEYYQQDHCC